MSFQPIAIVGRGCVLPGALTPQALWEAIAEGRDLVRGVPEGRWGLSRRHVIGSVADAADRTWSDRGGYVTGFDEVFDPTGFAVDESTVSALDPLFQWSLHAAREALRDAGYESGAGGGLVMGNLSFPPASANRLGERAWLGEELADAAGVPRPDPRNRFSSGLPAHLVARALGLDRAAFALDAACASSLVAIKLACDRLHDGSADLMLAGAVNCADDLFIHVGFCALEAMSRTGQTRPFHAEADGLVPAEGAAMVVLKRLDDALEANDRIYGTITGVGLSNDGRGSGLLVPSKAGQERAMRSAYEQAGWKPSDVSLVECHATGTTIGDRTELESMGAVFDGCDSVAIGSLKSNMGHLITAAGVAGLLKVLGAIEHGVRPPTLHCEPANGAIEGGAFRLLRQGEAWDGPRRAAVSAFGFGGNNAHLLVEAPQPAAARAPATVPAPARAPIAVVAMSRHDDPQSIELPLGKVRFPPNDLAQTLPQQLLVLQAALEATDGLDLPPERTSVLIGMGCDIEIARYGARWRAADWVESWGAGDLAAVRESFTPVLQAAGVLGTMPNIPANRINSQLDLGGPSMTVSAEELSGVRALEIATRALRAGEIDAAVVGAVDLCRNAAHEAAAAAVGIPGSGADGAVVLVLERLDEAQSRRRPILAILDDVDGEPFATPRHGAHAASGLLSVATAIASLDEGQKARLDLSAMGGQRTTVTLVGGPANPRTPAKPDRPLRFEPHLPPVALPALDAEPPEAITIPVLAPGGPAVMGPAPKLAPILELDEIAPPQSVPVPAPAPVPTAAAGTRSPITARMAAHHAQLAQVHQQFMEQQAVVQQQFLAMRQRTSQALLDAYSSRGVATGMPPVPRSAPVPVPAPDAAPKPVAQTPQTPPAPQAPATKQEGRRQPTGLSLGREQLEIHASGAISTIFGAELADQDQYARQVRMPRPPLLLADRMTGLDAELASMGRGVIWTETDVREDSWYLHDGRMPAGIMIESGQADLMLISYLGIDLFNKGERVYRLLGCELTWHGGLPAPGDTLSYEIHCDGHARQGDIRLFFFHYDCHIGDQRRLSVREGQAGFFSEAELAESMGVLWAAEEVEPAANARVDAAAIECTRSSFTHRQLEAFAAGNVAECFGPGFELAGTHTRTARIAGGRMLFLDEVTHFEPAGGPWGRGYLRAVDEIEPDDWFFDGHFHNDPCMPGTLMFEGCLQAMSVFMAGLGYTVKRDGWRFEPVPEQPYQMRCRGEVDPDSRELIYEVFVEEVHDGPEPTLYADLLCTVDGLKAFHCKRMGLKLSPGTPLDSRADLFEEHVEPKPVATTADGFEFGYDSLLACAWGKPSRAFGPNYARFDDGTKVPRLPGPPYHFMSRIARIDGELWTMKGGVTIEAEYDVPDDAWYFRENGGTMPFAVLLEAALQPCGWLASATGCALQSEEPLFFRNLDGTGTLEREILPGAGTLVTRVKSTSVSQSAGMIINGFEVECSLDGETVYAMDTVFGFFPGEALANQVGLTTTDEQRAVLTAESRRSVELEPSFLNMIDRVTGIWPEQGRYRAEKDVDPEEWFFQAHFYNDPVQPGSLGIEAMIQLLQWAMQDRGLCDGVEDPRFEPLALGEPLTWKYRGQVRPHNRVISSTIEIVEEGPDWAKATASLWVDDMRIYEASNLGMRVVSGSSNTLGVPRVLDLESSPWLKDHQPTWTVPAAPMMSMVDWIAQAAWGEGRLIHKLEKVTVKRWLPIDGAVTLQSKVVRDGERADVTLLADGEPVATGVVHLGSSPDMGAAPWPALQGERADDPYESGALFHGPAFQALKQLTVGDSGASAILDASPGSIPLGVLNPRLLDAATHAIPHDRLHEWCADIGADQVAYPALITELVLHGRTPRDGEVRCEVRFDGFFGGPRYPSFRVQLIAGDRLWAAFKLVEALFPKGPLGMAEPLERRAFLRDRQHAEGVGLATADGDETVLCEADVDHSDWLPGTIQDLYGTRHANEIVEREHVGRLVGVHPGSLPSALPLNTLPVEVCRDGARLRARTSGPEVLDLAPVVDFWTDWFDRGPWPVEDLYYGLIDRFVRRVVVPNPAAFEALRGRSVLYLANHQVGVESLLFSVLASGLSGVPTVTLAKAEHRDTWLGRLISHCFTYPGVPDPKVIEFFERDDRESLPRIISELAVQMAGPGRSVMVHVEGTRSLECRTPVQKMSGAFIDMALKVGAPVVPVRFVGALPAEPLDQRIEFPIDMGKQDLWIGRPLLPEELASMPYGDRKKLVIESINALGPSNAVETPNPGDPAFQARVDAHMAETGVSEEHAALHEVLRDGAGCPDSEALLAGGPWEGPQSAWLEELARRIGTAR